MKMTERKKYIRIVDRIGFENIKCWSKGYTFTGEHYVSPLTGIAKVQEIDELFSNCIRVHLIESVEITFKE